MQFRKDINGLRAIAVIAVVLFHFNASWMPGGFAGVDVFFVISGFLMTGIIFRGIEKDNFEIWKFYVARADRIIPALALLCLCLLIFGWLFTLDFVFESLAKHIATSISFISNFTYWQEAGYFDAASHEKWLLHTWSLSAEWQFYMIYPLTLVAMSKLMSVKLMKISVLIGTVLGFVFCVFASYRWPDMSYYLLPTRAWEMMMGGVAYLYPFTFKNHKKKLVEWLGVILIIGSYLLITKDTPWPGYFAILPVLGSFLIIQAQRNDSLITSNIIFQKLGAWSYSIYLWHWPLVVYMYTYMESNVINISLLIIASVILGMLSNVLVERKIAGKKVLVLFLITLGSSAIVYLNNGHFDVREKSSDVGNQIINTYKNYKMDPTGLWEKCNPSAQIVSKGSPEIAAECISSQIGGVFLWGDSHMGSLSTGLRLEIDENTPFSQLASPGCEPSFNKIKTGPDRSSKACNYLNSVAQDAILKAEPSVVILAIRRHHELNDWPKTVSRLYEIGVPKVVIVGPLPQWQPSLPLTYVKQHIGKEFIVDPAFDKSLIKSNQFLIDLHAKNKNFIFINMLANLCFKSETIKPNCRVKVGDSLLAFDYGHLTLEASRFVAKNYVAPLL